MNTQIHHNNNHQNQATLFTDGSSRGNPGPGGWAAIVAYVDHVTELGGGESHTTNNKMEIRAALEGLKDIKRHVPNVREVVLYTDSKYLINGATKWVYGWQKNGWVTSTKEPVLNKDLWHELAETQKGLHIVWNYVGGHIGVPANERCDEIATLYADGSTPELFSGPRTKYAINLDATISDENLASEKKEKKNRSSAKAYSYVSFVDGIFKTHTNWADCEREVKGKKGAKFKKTFSSEEEATIREVWQG